MKKLALLISALALSANAMSEDISRDFTLVHEISSSCIIDVLSNQIEDGSLVIGTAESATLTFGCNQLNGVLLTLSSQNGGLQKGLNTENLIHYTAKVNTENLEPLTLDTTTGSRQIAGTFTGEGSESNGYLEVTLKQPEGFSVGSGRYEDKLTLTLTAPAGSA